MVLAFEILSMHCLDKDFGYAWEKPINFKIVYAIGCSKSPELYYTEQDLIDMIRCVLVAGQDYNMHEMQECHQSELLRPHMI